jgi:hypothetical protein
MAVRVLALAFVIAQVVSRGKPALYSHFVHALLAL